jgi:predicted dehydrogenase
MKQVVQNVKNGAIEVLEVPLPAVSPGFVLVRVSASLVSAGTERAAIEFGRQNLFQKARSRPHLVTQVLEKVVRDGPIATWQAVSNRLGRANALGYSCAGTVLEVGVGVQHVKPGDPVACAGAGYASHAEVVAVPKNLVVRLPRHDATLIEEAAFTTLGSIALHGVRLGAPRLGEVVGVIGLGLLGQVALQLLKAAGCTVVGFDPNPQRMEQAVKLGIHAACSTKADFVAACLAASDGHGTDVTVITAATSSDEPVEMAGEMTRDKGRVVAVGEVGLRIPRRPYFQRELEFVVSRSYGPGRYDPQYEEQGRDYPYAFVRWTEQRNMQAFVDLLGRGAISMAPLITHRFSIEQAGAAYDLISGRVSEPYLGVVITYPGDVQTLRRVDLRPAGHGAVAPLGNRTGIGVVGAGSFMTGMLLPALKRVPGVELAGIVNRTGVSARNVAQRFGFSYAAAKIGELLADPCVDLIVIGTPHHLHAQQVIATLAAGKHVFVEKPLCLTRDELSAIEQAVLEAPNSCLMVGFNRRFAPLALKLREMTAARSEPLVAHYRVNAGYIAADHWVQDPAVGGGRLLGEGCHFFDWMCWLIDRPVTRVFTASMADAGRYRGDNFVSHLHFEDGSIGTLTYVANGSRQAGKERIEVFCEGSTLVLEDFNRLEISARGRLRPEVIKTRQADKGHAEECRLLIQALQTGSPAPIAIHDLLHSTAVTLMADESLRSDSVITEGH